ncbi:MAG TPA: SAM-dependent methyltransferase, partial [Vicinamibacterales bacterium]|nr:SAM-dependent methyltransferase [Vicinamibacterales bacterium]
MQHGSDILGFLELPVSDGAVPPAVIKDAVAREYGWAILGRFFDRAVYSEVRRRGVDGREQAVRHGVVLADIPNPARWETERHDRIGWTVFLQELWDRPEWASGDFYDLERVERGVEKHPEQNGWISVDVLDPPADWTTDRSTVHVELTIGGMPVCVLEVSPEAGVIAAARLRALLTTAAGVELVHVAVREALIGAEWTSGNLRDLLASRRARTGARSEPRPDAGMLAPRSAHIAAELLAADAAPVIIGARRHGPPGSAASRRAVLPGAAADSLVAAARAADEPVLTGSPPRAPERVLYAPELLSAGAQQPLASVVSSEKRSNAAFGRHHFEALFASGADPWRYTTPYEARKYEQTLSLLPPGPIARALEVGCAEGHFTDVLAARVERLVAADIAAIAIERAAARCAARPNVSFARVDIVRDPLPGDNDVIVCSEMLYFVGTVDDLHAVCRKLRDALRDGGRLITAHANVVADTPNGTAYAWDLPFG